MVVGLGDSFWNAVSVRGQTRLVPAWMETLRAPHRQRRTMDALAVFMGYIVEWARVGLRVIAGEDHYFSAGSKGAIITSPDHR